MIAVLGACAAADRAGVFGHDGDDRARFDHRAANVVEVIDGDSIRVASVREPRESAMVRLLGVDAPDPPSSHWSAQAKTYTSNRLRGRTVTLRFDPVQTRTTDGYLLAFVYINDGDCLNVDIVRDGQAYADRRIKSSLRSLIETGETDARKKKRGLWKDLRDDQMPQWRQQWLDQLRRERATLNGGKA